MNPISEFLTGVSCGELGKGDGGGGDLHIPRHLEKRDNCTIPLADHPVNSCRNSRDF